MRAWIMGGASVVAMLAGAPSAQDAASETADVQEVVVTGLRTARTDYVAESPIVTVGAAAVEARGPATLEAGATDLGLYDLLQRRYFVGVKRSFRT